MYSVGNKEEEGNNMRGKMQGTKPKVQRIDGDVSNVFRQFTVCWGPLVRATGHD